MSNYTEISFAPFGKAIGERLEDFVQRAREGKGVIATSATLTGEEVYDAYLAAFPEGTNPIFRERTEHDCNCCKNFIRRAGNILFFDDTGKVETLWAVEAESFYGVVANTLDKLVRVNAVFGDFFYIRPTDSHEIGSAPTLDSHDLDIQWNHFHYNFAAKAPEYILDGPTRSERLAALTTIQHIADNWDLNSVRTVAELVNTNTLYRGEDYKHIINDALRFVENIGQYNDMFTLLHSVVTKAHVSRAKNSSIGQLVDKYIETGDLEASVSFYENMVAPANYKRTKAIATPRMIQEAKRKVEELGLTDSFNRRLATMRDIPLEHVLYTSSSNKTAALADPFDALINGVTTKVDPQSLKGVKEISLEEFLSTVVPSGNQLELLVTSDMSDRLITLTTAENPDAPKLFNWDNPVAWAYTGDLADTSIREKVKKAGGKVDAPLRVSLAWYDIDDLDLYVDISVEGKTGTVKFRNRNFVAGGLNATLDVDMNVTPTTKEPVENVYFNYDIVPPRKYSVFIRVNNYTRRSADQSFNIEVETPHGLYTLAFNGNIPSGGTVDVARAVVVNGKITSIEPASSNIRMGSVSNNVGGIESQKFYPINYITESPNYWLGSSSGIRHIMFLLEGVKTEEPVRAYFNEFLRPELQAHRKVFEMLGTATLLETANKDQVTGFGYNKQQSGTVFIRATGNTQRIYKVLI